MVEFVVTVPPGSPTWEPLYLAGGGAALGDWAAAGVPLEPWADGTARAAVAAPPGTPFLVTRGTWRGVESDGRGHARPPRVVGGLDSVAVEVTGFGRDGIDDYPDFRSAWLPHARTVSVSLPPGYDHDPSRRYPVLYMHDGQNLFDAATSFAGVPWAADETAEREARRGAAAPLLIVGVGNSPDRLREYGPRPAGDGDDLSVAYGRFLVEELKPFIDANYRTAPGPESAGVAGSSMGGLISLALARRYPEVFGRCAALSPSLWWDRELFLREAGWPQECRVWLDTGEDEGVSRAGRLANVARTRRLARLFTEAGLRDGRDFAYREVPGGTHNEASWGARFGDVLRFLFPAGEFPASNSPASGVA